VSVHDGFVDEEIGFYIDKIRRALSAPGSILKGFEEPVSMGVKVIFLVDGQHNG
jgi:hypothetical protein